MDHIDQDGFRANVGIVISDASGSLLLGGRKGQKGWQFPQGGIQLDETPEQAMYRELWEEVGLRPDDVELLASTRKWLRYRLPPRYLRKNTRPLCIGQKQRWFLLRLLSDDSCLRLDCSEQPEFDRWRWVDYWKPVREVIYFKRPVYACALEELAPVLFPDGPPPRPDWWQAEWQAAGVE